MIQPPRRTTALALEAVYAQFNAGVQRVHDAAVADGEIPSSGADFDFGARVWLLPDPPKDDAPSGDGTKEDGAEVVGSISPAT